jgi:hypothetical protein
MKRVAEVEQLMQVDDGAQVSEWKQGIQQMLIAGSELPDVLRMYRSQLLRMPLLFCPCLTEPCDTSGTKHQRDLPTFSQFWSVPLSIGVTGPVPRESSVRCRGGFREASWAGLPLLVHLHLGGSLRFEMAAEETRRRSPF